MTFTGNDAAGSGGAIYVSSPDKLWANGTTFILNLFEIGGAAALSGRRNVDTKWLGCVFEGNDATSGGALHLYGSDKGDVVENSTLRGNYVGQHLVIERGTRFTPGTFTEELCLVESTGVRVRTFVAWRKQRTEEDNTAVKRHLWPVEIVCSSNIFSLPA